VIFLAILLISRGASVKIPGALHGRPLRLDRSSHRRGLLASWELRLFQAIERN
jgi:hypothetical protein